MDKKVQAQFDNIFTMLGTTKNHTYNFADDLKRGLRNPEKDLPMQKVGSKEILLSARIYNAGKIMSAHRQFRDGYIKASKKRLTQFKNEGDRMANMDRCQRLCGDLHEITLKYLADIFYYFYQNFIPTEQEVVDFFYKVIDPTSLLSADRYFGLEDFYADWAAKTRGDARELKRNLDEQARRNFDNGPRTYHVTIREHESWFGPDTITGYAYELPRSTAPLYGAYGANEGSAMIHTINEDIKLYDTVLESVEAAYKMIAEDGFDKATNFLERTYTELVSTGTIFSDGTEIEFNPWNTGYWLKMLPIYDHASQLGLVNVINFYGLYDKMFEGLKRELKRDMEKYFNENGTCNEYYGIYAEFYDWLKEVYCKRKKIENDEEAGVMNNQETRDWVHEFYLSEYRRVIDELAAGKKRYKEFDKYAENFIPLLERYKKCAARNAKRFPEFNELLSRAFEAQKPKGFFH